ncbi:hypothetical protein D3C85_1413430 [compost metagenome]
MGIFLDQAEVDAIFIGGREERGEANAHTLLANDASNCLGDFAQEAQSILQRATIFIITLVCVGGNELVHQVAVRAVQFHPIEPSVQGIAGRLGIELDQFFHLCGGKSARGRWIGQCTRARAGLDEYLDVVRLYG